MISNFEKLNVAHVSLIAIMIVGGLALSTDVYAQHVLDTLEPGNWYEVPNSRMESVNPCPSVSCPPGNSGFKGIMIAWSGGALDKIRNRLLVWGGGHADYSGNGIYAFDIPSLNWIRLTDPSTNVGGDFSTYLYPDGKPRALHTWDYIEHVPSVDKFISFGGVAPYPGSGYSYKVFAYSFNSNQWDTNGIPNVPSGGELRGANAVYDPITGNVWVHTSNSVSARLNQYHTDTNTWTSHGGRTLNDHSVTALDPQRRLLVTVGAGQIFVWDLKDPDAAPFQPSTSGSKILEGRNSPGFEFDTSIRKFVGWDGGTSVYVLDPDTWVWTEQRAATGNSVTPSAPPDAGTHGRFRYVPDYNAYVVVSNTSESVYLYRLSGEAVKQPNPTSNLEAN